MYFKIKLTKQIWAIIIFAGILLTLMTISNNKNFIRNVMAEKDGEALTLPIIMYHSVMKDERKRSKFIISVNEFEEDLKYLNEKGYTTIFMQDLIDYVYEDKKLPEKPIILTFDDGYYNNYLYVFPLLKKYDCKMVLSPIGKQTDLYSENPNTSPAYAHVTWNNLKEMVESGLVDIQNHSYDMHTVGKGRRGSRKNKNESLEHYAKFFKQDIEKLQKKIEENLGIKPTTFAFPFGAVSNCSVEILKEMGFLATLSCEGKINKVTKDKNKLFGLYRILRPGKISTEKFFKSKIEN